jgi:flagellar biosynthesis protein FliQ
MAGIIVLTLCLYLIVGCVVATHGKMPQVNLQTLTGLARLVAAGFLNTDDGPV